jgi:hypothetical protein
MADDRPFTGRLFIGGVDLSAHVQSVSITPAEIASVEGASAPFTEPMTLAFEFDRRLICPSCGMRFTPTTSTPVPHFVVTHPSLGNVDCGPACDACTVQHFSD